MPNFIANSIIYRTYRFQKKLYRRRYYYLFFILLGCSFFSYFLSKDKRFIEKQETLKKELVKLQTLIVDYEIAKTQLEIIEEMDKKQLATLELIDKEIK